MGFFVSVVFLVVMCVLYFLFFYENVKEVLKFFDIEGLIYWILIIWFLSFCLGKVNF